MFFVTPQMMQSLQQALTMAGPQVGQAAQLAKQALPDAYAQTPSQPQAINVPQADASGRIQQVAPQVTNGQVEAALQGANAPGLAPQLAASKEAALQTALSPTPAQPQAQQGQSSIGIPQAMTQQVESALASGVGGELSAPAPAQAPTQGMDKSWWQTIADNLTGRNLNSPEALENWQKWQAIGAMGTRVGGAIAGDNTPVGQASNALSNTFAGNLSAKNAELNTRSQNDYMQKALAGLTGQSTAPQGQPTQSSAAQSLADTANQLAGNEYKGVQSSLSGQQLAKATDFSSLEDISSRMRRLSGLD